MAHSHDHAHDHSHDHDHSHGHDHHHHGLAAASEMRFDRAFGIGIGLNLVFVVAETAGGLWANSSALLSDAGHNLSDVLSLALAWGATQLAKKPSSERYTYGFKSATIQAALINAALLYAALGFILWDTIEHLRHPAPVNGYLVMLLAGIGIVINGFTAYLFHKGQHGDVNLRGAYLHMLTDALVSLGVVIGGGLVTWTGWQWLDPAIGFIILGIIAYSSWGLLRETVQLTMLGVPDSIDLQKVRQRLLTQPGVTQVHDLHVWPMSTRDTALTVHLVRPGHGCDSNFLQHIQKVMQDEFSICHCTVQVEEREPVMEESCGCT